MPNESGRFDIGIELIEWDPGIGIDTFNGDECKLYEAK